MNKIYKFNYHWLNELSKHKDMLDNDTGILVTYIEVLQQENKQLKEELETLKDGFDFNLGAIENIRKGKNKLEEKIDKAIEYIKESCVYDEDDGYEEKIYSLDVSTLLEILGDKENE